MVKVLKMMDDTVCKRKYCVTKGLILIIYNLIDQSLDSKSMDSLISSMLVAFIVRGSFGSWVGRRLSYCCFVCSVFNSCKNLL